ncbi:hypothetical protein H6F89_24720 [Cyanobacteria bacterium FACHB-63]|nr:hypothetical protein [Cyanobacteria bacterium FACHB-63]
MRAVSFKSIDPFSSGTAHPYTCNGVEVEVRLNDTWVEVGEGGEVHPKLLKPGYTGLATGWELDRLAMLVKGMDDIRLLRSARPKIAAQMKTLNPYISVSNQPKICRDLSIVVAPKTELEDLCESLVQTLGEDAELLESVEILNETAYDQLPASAIQRLGIRPHQKNLLIRMTLQRLHTSISNQKANLLRDLVYQQLHQGLSAYSGF